MTGITRQKFDDLWSAPKWSCQSKERPQGVSHTEHMDVDKLYDLFFNQHQEDNLIPSEWICAHEAISRWYKLGDHWINFGLPMYMAIGKKAESDCEIQNSACGKSGVML